MKGSNELTSRILAQASEATKRKNPHLFGHPVSTQEPERAPALGGQTSGKPKGQAGRRYRVLIIGLRKRILDSDNFIGGTKATRDAIAAHLGLDDADRFIAWEYHQTETKGDQGLIVVVTEL